MKKGTPTGSDILTDDAFVAMWFALDCSASRMAAERGCTERSVYKRASTMRARGIDLPSPAANSGAARERWTYPREHRARIEGVVMCASDLHCWPTSHQARPIIQEVFAELSHRLQPAGIVLAGDLIDGTRISRHPSMRGQAVPKVSAEAQAMEAYVNCLYPAEHRFVQPGNHDFRVDAYLSANAPEMDDWSGRLFDRIPDYLCSYSLVINETLEVMHNWHGGIHGAYNNALRAGYSFMTGHTHQLECKPVVNRLGRNYGVELGTLNDPLGPQFEYAQNRPSRATGGFAVIEFDDKGRLLPPELCTMDEGRAIFRGKVLNKPRFRVKALSGVSA